MTTLEMLSNYIAAMSPHHRGREGGRLLIEAKAEIERLEKENAKLKAALENICGLSSIRFEVKASEIAQEALRE